METSQSRSMPSAVVKSVWSPRIALPSIATRLDRKGEAKVSIVVEMEGGRGPVEVELPGRFGVSPAMTSALRSMAGVLAVETV